MKPGSTISTGGHRPYLGLGEYAHATVEHAVGTIHPVSEKHLGRSVDECATRHHQLDGGTMADLDQRLRHAGLGWATRR